MKIGNQCTLIITLESPPEVRFTSYGKRMVSARAVGLTRVAFQLWENTLEDEAMVNAFVNLTFHDALIKVAGQTKIMRYGDGLGNKQHEYIIFTIEKWSKIT